MALATTPNDFFSIVTTGSRTSGILQSLLGMGELGAHLDDPADAGRQRSLWAAKLDHAVMGAQRPVLLVASGRSCFAATWWARLSPRDYIDRVAGALFVDPLEADGASAALFASPRTRLPFPSLLLSGERADGEAVRRAQDLALEWGGMVDAASRGEAPSRWQGAREFVMRMTAGVVERRAQAAYALAAVLDPPQR
ncbi:alpha/beta hydrolase [Sphingomonas sp. HT-1]|uniref:alpha/beta hydrolase n=1 Tax=unclassified Sphingomonas TaxID=196159 RepID=UPI0003069F7C|nr:MULTISPECIES: alpha/beta hydrolase [unclassified Sphingomonas]